MSSTISIRGEDIVFLDSPNPGRVLKLAREGDGSFEVAILIELDDAIGRTIEEWNDFLEERIIGKDAFYSLGYAAGIHWNVVGLIGDKILLNVNSDIDPADLKDD